jgi:hypothetical protein
MSVVKRAKVKGCVGEVKTELRMLREGGVNEAKMISRSTMDITPAKGWAKL